MSTRVAGFRYTNEAVGALVLVTVLIFVLALVQAGRIREWFDPGATIRVILPDEGLFGLTEGAPVEILGTKAGEVRRIVLAPDQHIHAVIYVRKAMLAFVRRDSQAIIRKQFDMPLWHSLASCLVIPYISSYPCVTTLMLGRPGRSVAPETASMTGRSPLSSRHQPRPSLPASYPMPRCYASRRVRSMTRRPRSPCACSRRRPAHPVRCARSQRGVSIVTTGAPWRTCPGRSIGCASSSVSANGFVVIATAAAVSSPNGCPPSRPLGRDARCGSLSA